MNVGKLSLIVIRCRDAINGTEQGRNENIQEEYLTTEQWRKIKKDKKTTLHLLHTQEV